MPQASPAVCEIDGCGVQAIGRCATCKRAFCASHQASDSYRAYTNLCASCQEANRAESRKQEEERQKAALAAQEYFRSGSARTALLAAKVPSVTISLVGEEVKYKYWSGRRVAKKKIYSVECGWILGELSWSIGEYDRYEQTTRYKRGSRLTALLDKPSYAALGDISYGLVCVQLTPEGYEASELGMNRFGESMFGGPPTGEFANDWIEAIQAVKRLAGNPASP